MSAADSNLYKSLIKSKYLRVTVKSLSSALVILLFITVH